MLASGACKDKGTVRVKVDRCKGESENDSESEGKREDEAESKLREEIVQVTEIVEEVDRISRHIFYLINGGHIGPGFDKFLDYLLFPVFGSF